MYGDAAVRLVKTVDGKEIYSDLSYGIWMYPNGINIDAYMEVNNEGKPVYTLNIDSWNESKFTGYEIYKVERIDKPLVKVDEIKTNEYEVVLTGNKPVTYFIRAYEEVDGHKFYTYYDTITLKPLNVYNVEEGLYRVSDTSAVLKNGIEPANVIRHPNYDWGYVWVDDSINTISTTGTIQQIDFYDKKYKSQVGTGLYVLDRELEYTKFYNAGWGTVTLISKDGTETPFSEQYDLIEIENRDYILVKVEWTTLQKLEREEHPASTLTDGLYVAHYNIEPGIYAFSKDPNYEWPGYVEFKNQDSKNVWINDVSEIAKVFLTVSDTDTVIVDHGTLTKVDMESLPVNIKTTLSNDSFVVGKDLEPGLYELETDEGSYNSCAKIYNEVGSEDYEYHSTLNNMFEIREDAKVVEVRNATLRKVDANNINVELEEDEIVANKKNERWAFYCNNGGFGVVATDPEDRSTWTIITGNEHHYMKVDEDTTVYTYGVGHYETSILDKLRLDKIITYNSAKGVFECTLDSSNISEFDGWQVIVDEEPYYLSPEEVEEKAIDNDNGVSHVSFELAKDENHNIYTRVYKMIDGEMVYSGWNDYVLELIPRSYPYDAGNGLGLSYVFAGTVNNEDIHCELYKCDHYSENIGEYELVMTDFSFNEGVEGGYYYITRLTVDMDGEEIVGTYSDPFYYAG